jgi:plasmid stability protein
MKGKHTAISVRLPDGLHEQLRLAAVANERTVAQETRRLLSLQLEREHEPEEAKA